MCSLFGSVGSVYQSLTHGMAYLLSGAEGPGQGASGDRQGIISEDPFDDDMRLASRDNFNSPLVMIDTQNKIWLKIISREKKNYEEKIKLLQLQKETDVAVVKKDFNNSNSLSEFAKRNTKEDQMSGFRKFYSGTMNMLLFGPRLLASGINRLNDNL